MRILVTGGAGFIGSHIVDAYIEAGHTVTVVDDLSTGHRDQVHPQAHFYQADVTKADELARIVAAEQPDVVSHQAAQKSVRLSVEDPAADANINILGTLHLLELCRRSGVQHVLFASTGGAIYGDADRIPTPEETPAWPISPYGIAKLTVEHYLYYYQHQYGLTYTALRYANVYGPRQDPHGEAGVVAIFAERLLSGQTAVIYGDGSQTRDYVYVGDVAAANLRALQTRAAGAYNVGTGVETTVNALYAALAEAMGVSRPPQYAPARPGEQGRSALDARRAADTLDWRPRVSLADGLRRTVDHFRRKTA
jgi:UDP-glucose 4-epimerase